MKKNWIIEEAKKADKSKDVVILENPDRKKFLDDLLLNRFWPVIRNSLENSIYNYLPQEKPETEFEFSHILTRALSFMLLDETKAFYRGKLSCSMEAWMLENEFFMALSKDNDLQLVFEILGNSRLRGNPPTLSIDKDSDDFYQITLHAGSGAGWGLYNEHYVEQRIKEVITHPINGWLDGCEPSQRRPISFS